MLRAFTRTQALRGPGRADVELAMSKWWTKKRPAEGQVRTARSKSFAWCSSLKLFAPMYVPFSLVLKLFSVILNWQITRTISAHEQHPVGPWLKTFPKKTIERAPSYILWVGGSAGLTYGSISLADGLTKAEDYSHRP
jgi:hypothetical protein